MLCYVEVFVKQFLCLYSFSNQLAREHIERAKTVTALRQWPLCYTMGLYTTGQRFRRKALLSSNVNHCSYRL